jgi:hypothetical protein
MRPNTRKGNGSANECANGTCDHLANLFYEAMIRLMGQEGIQRFMKFLSEASQNGDERILGNTSRRSGKGGTRR